jgi:Flp pilus assembly protein protease CpaA
MLPLIIAAAFFGCLAYLGMQLSCLACAEIAPFDDGPLPGNPPGIWLILGSALLGAVLMGLGAQPFALGIAALVLLALVAVWCSDASCGVIPDVFTLGPVAAIALFLAIHHQWGQLLWALVPIVPFAVAAAASHGRGMGWGDVKLCAIAGLALGAPLALFALACACALVVCVHRLKHLRRDQPIAFAPYIATAIALALPLGVMR